MNHLMEIIHFTTSKKRINHIKIAHKICALFLCDINSFRIQYNPFDISWKGVLKAFVKLPIQIVSENGRRFQRNGGYL